MGGGNCKPLSYAGWGGTASHSLTLGGGEQGSGNCFFADYPSCGGPTPEMCIGAGKILKSGPLAGGTR